MEQESSSFIEKKNNQSRLPFSFRNAITMEALTNLGLTESDFTFQPKSYFKKFESDPNLVDLMYNKYTEERNRLIGLVVDERKRLSEQKKESRVYKKDPSVIIERRMADINNMNLEQKNEASKQFLRRLAISQMRNAFKMEKVEKMVNENNAKAVLRAKKERIKLLKAQELAQAKIYEPRQKSEVDSESIMKKCTEDIREHLERQEKLKEEEKKRIQKMRQEEDNTRKKVFENQERIYREKLEKCEKRVNYTEQRLAQIPLIQAENRRAYTERNQRIVERSRDVKMRSSAILEEKARELQNQIHEKDKRYIMSARLVERESRKKLEYERFRLDRLNDAAEKIFEEKRIEMEQRRSNLDKKELELNNRLSELRKAKRKQLLSRSLDLKAHSNEVKRMQKAREAQFIKKRIESMIRDTSEYDSALKARYNSKNCLSAADKQFKDQKNRVLCDLNPQTLAGMPETAQVRSIINTIGCSESEAKDIIRVAREPSSLYTRDH